MIQTLIRNWWLLALCGIADAIYSAGNFLMKDPEVRITVAFLGRFALAAGACALAAGIWRSGKGKSWMLVLNGAALSVFGLISIFWSRGRLAFLPVALVLVVMAVSLGVFALATAPTLRRHTADQRLLSLVGAASLGFALSFLAVGFRWIRLEQPGLYFIWMSGYFGFSAICMLALGLRLKSLRMSVHRLAAGT
jgi:uncharacterized membrane protein HdeD (DUF308 family)